MKNAKHTPGPWIELEDRADVEFDAGNYKTAHELYMDASEAHPRADHSERLENRAGQCRIEWRRQA